MIPEPVTVTVELTITVTTTGSWNVDHTMGQIVRQAEEEAKNKLNRLFLNHPIHINKFKRVEVAASGKK